MNIVFNNEFPFDYKFSGFNDVRGYNLPIVTTAGFKLSSKRPRILIVLDYVPTEDLKSGQLLSGASGAVFNVLVDLAQKQYPKDYFEDIDVMVTTFNAFKTAGQPLEFQNRAKNAFADRLRSIIVTYEPDTVIVFGEQVYQYLLYEQTRLTENLVNWHGHCLSQTVTYKQKSVTTTFVANISLNTIVNGSTTGAYLIGYAARKLAIGLLGHNPYGVNDKRLRAHKSIYVDTIEKFDECLDIIASAKVVSVDTEAASLAKHTNTLLTIQFAKDELTGYCIPVNHKDSPFLPKEKKYIEESLKNFFEGDNDNEYHIYANAVFDLTLLKAKLGIKYFYNNVYDIFAGEYIIDETHKFLLDVTSRSYYSVANISMQYGFTGYLDAPFSKQHRKNMAQAPLSKDFVYYSTLDVVVPFAIHTQQLRYAKNLKYDKFKSLVVEQCSDLLHGQSIMTYNGSLVDIPYLFGLQAKTSPIEKAIGEITDQFLSSPAVIKTAKLLSTNQGMPEKSLFGDVKGIDAKRVFKFKETDKQILFFKVLKLEPLEMSAKGNGKLDKAFQTRYADVLEVKLYTQLEKAKKLRNAFVKSFIKLLGSDADFKHDHHIRPNYHYLRVLSGRTSATDPNMQQIPSHSALGKHIKRLFVAPKGTLYVKVDYRVHEVRGWSIISQDTALAEVFKAARRLRQTYLKHPTPELAKKVKVEADPHVSNAIYFFNCTAEESLANDKELRNAVKTVVFGLIYQMSLASLAASINKSLEYATKLAGNFQKRFPRGMGWIDTVKREARKLYYAENPLGFRRHLWGYALPTVLSTAKRIYAEMDRRAVNSPIQGMCAQFMAIGLRALDSRLHRIRVKEDREVDIRPCNSVHDSLENVAAYLNILESISLLETSLTSDVERIVKKRHNFDFVVGLEIDIDFGATLADCDTWDGSITQLYTLLLKAVVKQKYELKYDIDVNEVMDIIFIDGWDYAPDWLKEQAITLDWEYQSKRVNKDVETLLSTPSK